MKNEKSKTTRKQALSGRAAAYVRVSTTDQGERYSPASQLKALRDKAERAGRTIPDEWVFSDAHSGKQSSRPAFDKLKALVKTGAPDAVYIYDVSRFARKTMDALWLAAEFKRHGVGLDFVEMPYEDTPTGRLTFTQMAAVAEFLGEKIIEDSTRGRLEKLQSGKLDHGMAPDGYAVKDSVLVVNPERAKIWQDIFRWRATEHLAKYAICHRLNRAGIPSARGGLWAPRVISQNLRNRTYIGEHVRAGIVVPCPAIIDRKTFDEAKKWNEEARAKQVGRPSNRYLLTGFLWCAKCGKRFITNPGSVGSGHRPHANYKCGNIEYKPYKRLCHTPQVFCDVIEPAAWSEIWGTLTNPDLLMQLVEDYVVENNRKPESGDVARLERDRAKVNAQIREAQYMLHSLLISREAGAKMINADKERLAEIERQLAAAGSKVIALPTRQQVEAFCRELAERPEPGADCADDPRAAYDERRPVLEGILNLKMRYFDKDLEISGEIPLRSAESSGCDGAGACQNSDKDLTPYPNSGDGAVACIPFIRKVRVA